MTRPRRRDVGSRRRLEHRNHGGGGTLERTSRDLLLLAVWDVHMGREDPESALALAAPVLGAADVLFGNCEGVYTDGGVRAPGAGIPVVSALGNAQGLAAASFDVMNC